MTMRHDSFAAFILTHGRPDKQSTTRQLRACGYTGPIKYIVDDEDPTLLDYQQRYGDDVIVFSKQEIAERIDEGDPVPDRRSIVYARHAAFDIADQLGIDWHIQLDDDYTGFRYRTAGRWNGPDTHIDYHSWGIKSLDRIFDSMIDFLEMNPRVLTIAMSQAGDHFGGKYNTRFAQATLRRKAMNSFVCHRDRPIDWLGRFNEDVNTYTYWGGRGELFFTYTSLMLVQTFTQHNPGGMSEFYLQHGTYTKSMTTVMYRPDCTTFTQMGWRTPRMHHAINWNRAVPKIISEQHREP